MVVSLNLWEIGLRIASGLPPGWRGAEEASRVSPGKHVRVSFRVLCPGGNPGANLKSISHLVLAPPLLLLPPRFRGGLVFKAHRLVYHSTLGSRVIKKKKTLSLRRLFSSSLRSSKCSSQFKNNHLAEM